MLAALAMLMVTTAQPAPPPVIVRPVPRPPVAVPPPPPPPPINSARRPPRMLSGGIASDDYPAAAIRADAEGAVAVRLTVGENGRVVSCLVQSSSGSAVLDSATCQLAQRRFRFDPARDDNGRPASAFVTRRIVWRLPEEPLILFEPGSLIWTVEAGPQGVSSCRADAEGSAFAEYDVSLCRSDGDSELVATAEMPRAQRPVRITHILFVDPQGGSATPPPAPAAAVTESIADVEIDAEGRVIACVAVSQNGAPPAYAYPFFRNLCDELAGEPSFRPGTPGEVRRARLQSSLYVEEIAVERER